MAGFNGFMLPAKWLVCWGEFGQFLATLGVDFSASQEIIKGAVLNWISIGLLIVWLTPNSQQIMANFKPALMMPEEVSTRWLWHTSWAWLVVSVVTAVSAMLFISKMSEFIYFQF